MKKKNDELLKLLEVWEKADCDASFAEEAKDDAHKEIVRVAKSKKLHGDNAFILSNCVVVLSNDGDEWYLSSYPIGSF